ncbi:hypothetical protein D9Q98_007993 [Chlorella vulgaris]|uniref:Uncharacterized protein n=1 Tax=Chlorella vulgaris TaxID=3077 RepID=A0A9D4TI32_CHLVU|nr:hypothetical protein D9Q98_007993 [Chlorella vulgaris]
MIDDSMRLSAHSLDPPEAITGSRLLPARRQWQIIGRTLLARCQLLAASTCICPAADEGTSADHASKRRPLTGQGAKRTRVDAAHRHQEIGYELQSLEPWRPSAVACTGTAALPLAHAVVRSLYYQLLYYQQSQEPA